MQEKPGQKTPEAGANGLRRRVIFELDPGQLPLLEAAKERHGSMRATLIAALEAEAEARDLRDRLGAAEERLAKAERSAPRRQARKTASKKDEQALAKAAEREGELLAQLESARQVQSEEAERSRGELEEYAEALEERDEEIAELRTYPYRAAASRAACARLKAIRPLASCSRARWFSSFLDQRTRMPRLRLNHE